MSTTTVVTHNGIFHADEVFAVAILRRAIWDLEPIQRTRDEEAIAAATYVLDVGGVYDPAAHRFDHHQKGGAGVRENGVPYATAGLIWREHAFDYVGAWASANKVAWQAVAQEVDRAMIQAIDAFDCGKAVGEFKVGEEPLWTTTVSGVISLLNPSALPGSPKPSDHEVSVAFEAAVVMATTLLDAAVRAAMSRIMAEEIVRDCVDGPILALKPFCPWQKAVVETHPEVRFVVYESDTGTWMCQAVPAELGKFGTRLDLPAKWAGLRDAELAAVTGVEDAVFCHNARFLAGAKSEAGARLLAELALA